MRVLHLPQSAASQVSILVRALRENGVDAKGIVRGNHRYESSEGILDFGIRGRHANPMKGLMQRARWLAALLSSVRRADVIHWHFAWGTELLDLDLKLISSFKKAAIVEFWGSDVRIPEIASKHNPYYTNRSDADLNYGISYSASRRRQAKFAQHGFACLVPGPELPDYVQTDLFPHHYSSVAALFPSEFEPRYPDPSRSKPLIVHLPSNISKKGTDAVLGAIENLKSRHDFDFRLIHNVSRVEALKMMQECDILLDQFAIGSYGMVSLEAMAYGKPTICYLQDNVVARLPAGCPIVNANRDNLANVLEGLILDGSKRHEIGRLGRIYVEKHHNAHKVASDLARIYQELIAVQTRNHGNR